MLSAGGGMAVFGWIFYFSKKEKTAFLFVLLCISCLEAGFYTRQNHRYNSNSLRNITCSGYADFYGTLYRTPSRGRNNDRLFVTVNKVECDGRSISVKGNLRVTVRRTDPKQKITMFARGDKVKISARLLPRKNFANFAATPFENYLKVRNIHNRAVCKSPLLLQKQSDSDSWNPLNRISRFKQNLLEKIDRYFPSGQSQNEQCEGPLLEALLLGERDRIDPGLNQALLKSGLYHLLAISGAHIAILSFFIFSLFRLIRFPQRTSYLLLGFILVFYLLLIEGRPSVFRATLMALLFIAGKLLWNDVNLLNTVSLSAFILLIINPFYLQDAGFQLTYAATFSIILFFPALLKSLPKLPLHLSEIFAVTLAAQIGIIPIMICSFHRVALSSLLLNFIALPLVGLIMGFGYLFLFFSFLVPFLGKLCALAVALLIKIFIQAAELFDTITFLSTRLPSPPLWVVLGYVVSLLLFLLPKKYKGQVPLTMLLFFSFLLLSLIHPFTPSRANLKVTFVDVGQGDSTLVEFPGEKTMLVDGGGTPDDNFDIGEYVVSPFLWKKGLKKIDFVVLTHAHPDHMNGLKAVVRNFKIEEIWEAFRPENDPAYQQFRNAASSRVSFKQVFRGDSRAVGGVLIQALHPPAGRTRIFRAENNQSLVLKLSYEKLSILLTGDIEREAEESIVDSRQQAKSHILKVPHHGSRSSSTKTFVNIVAPRIAVICVGAGNRYLLPHEEIVKRYLSLGTSLYRTDIHGAIEVATNGTMLTLRTARQPRLEKKYFIRPGNPGRKPEQVPQ